MTPTEQEIEFFKEAKRIQELWEPKVGDWIKSPHGLGIIMRLPEHLRRPHESYEVITPNGFREGPYLKHQLIFLPRQGQLKAMLEERGWKWEGGSRKNDNGYEMTAWRIYQGGKSRAITRVGPTPSIALGKCLLEVLKEE